MLRVQFPPPLPTSPAGFSDRKAHLQGWAEMPILSVREEMGTGCFADCKDRVDAPAGSIPVLQTKHSVVHPPCGEERCDTVRSSGGASVYRNIKVFILLL